MPTTSSPLRYPGGKTALADFMAALLEKNGLLGSEYVEPFSGGAGIALKLLLTDKVERIVLNDYDISIWAFWECVLQRSNELCHRIEAAKFSRMEWEKQRRIQTHNSPSLLELGFSTLYMNRTNFSGIIRGGMIGGKKQEGPYKMNCRFNKQVLIRKIKTIAERRNQIKLYQQDCLHFLRQSKNFSLDALVYMDPPYYDAGNKLYLSNFDHFKHERLADIVSLLRQPWVMTYDAGIEIKHIHAQRLQKPFKLSYSANVKARGKEIFMLSKGLKLPYELPCH